MRFDPYLLCHLFLLLRLKIFENNLDKNTLQICLKTIKGKGKEEVLKELDTLLKLFNMDISKEKKEEIISNLNLLSKKEDIINIADALFLFIDNANLTRGKLWKLVEKIQKNKEELNNADVLKKYIQNLKDNNIDIEILYNKNYEYDNYINILLDLKEEPKAIAFILDKNEDDCNEMKITNESNQAKSINENLKIKTMRSLFCGCKISENIAKRQRKSCAKR